MEIHKHIERSLERTGKEYRDIHEWIDAPGTKPERHDLGKIFAYGEMWREKYGDEGAREYLYHLQEDVEGRFNHLVEDVQKIVNDNLNYLGCLTRKIS